MLNMKCLPIRWKPYGKALMRDEAENLFVPDAFVGICTGVAARVAATPSNIITILSISGEFRAAIDSIVHKRLILDDHHLADGIVIGLFYVCILF